MKIQATAAVVFLLASCSTYYEDLPPYYEPRYERPYPHGHGHGQAGAEARKIDNPDWDQSRAYGTNPAPTNPRGTGGGQGAPGGAYGGNPAPVQPSGPPVGILVPNRPGMIMSPYAQDPNKLIDVSGLPSGTVIQCPYSQEGQTIRVP